MLYYTNNKLEGKNEKAKRFYFNSELVIVIAIFILAGIAISPILTTLQKRPVALN